MMPRQENVSIANSDTVPNACYQCLACTRRKVTSSCMICCNISAFNKWHCGMPAGSSEAPQSTPPNAACSQSLEVAQDLLLQDCRLSGTQWQPGSVLTCSAWTLLAATLPSQPEALQDRMHQADIKTLSEALEDWHRCLSKESKAPALLSDSMLGWYLVISAKVSCGFLLLCYVGWSLTNLVTDLTHPLPLWHC